MAKDSFILYKGHFKQIKLLTMEERGELLTAIIRHVNGETPQAVSKAVAFCSLPIIEQLDRDAIKYQEECERNAKNGEIGARFGYLGKEFGKLGGRPKKDEKDRRQSYEEIMEDLQVSSGVKYMLWEFIKHCQLNGRTVTNKKLEDIIFSLDKRQCEEREKADILKKAIDGGFYDIQRI